jgi:hypothetical protein
MSDLTERLRRAINSKPEASMVQLSRASVEAMLDALDGKTVSTPADAARLIQRQPYSAVADALAAADDKSGEDAVTSFLNSLVAS